MTDLRDRLDAAVSTVEPRADLWTDVEHRLHVHRRRPIVLVAIAAAAAIVATAVIVPRLGNRSAVRVPAGPGESGTWRSIAKAPRPYSEGDFGGWTGQQLVVFDAEANSGQAYDPGDDAWRVLPPMPIGVRTGAAEFAGGGRFFVWGGTTADGRPLGDGASYDPRTSTWTVLPPSPLHAGPAAGIWMGTEVAVWELSAGQPMPHLASGAAFDPITNTWKSITAPSGDVEPEASLLWTGREVMVPGNGGDWWAFNPDADSWRHLPRLTSTEVVRSIGGKYYDSAGGRVVAFDRQPKIYAPDSDAWETAPAVPLSNGSGGVTPAFIVATDRELVTWGPYQTLGPGDLERVDWRGEALDVGSRTWRTFDLPSGVARGMPIVVWTGKDVLEWGGTGFPDGSKLDDGWAYTPPLGKAITPPAVVAPTTALPVRPTTASTVPTTPTTLSATCPTQAEVAARANKKPRVVNTTAPSDPVKGEHLDPPPPGASPKITADQAWASARNYMAPDPGPDPTITLATFTSSMTGTHLAWVLVLRNALITGPTGGPAPAPGSTATTRAEPPCYLGTTVQPVDAENGIAMGMAQGG